MIVCQDSLGTNALGKNLKTRACFCFLHAGPVDFPSTIWKNGDHYKKRSSSCPVGASNGRKGLGRSGNNLRSNERTGTLATLGALGRTPPLHTEGPRDRQKTDKRTQTNKDTFTAHHMSCFYSPELYLILCNAIHQ